MKSGVRSYFEATLGVVLFFASTMMAFAGGTGEIIVSAAASLKNVLETVGRKFEAKNPGSRITFNFGASGALVNQILGGAPADLLFSADIRDFDRLVHPEGVASGQGNLLIPGHPLPFLRNQLVLVVPGKSTLEIKSLAGLASNDWKKIAIGNPRTVPAGRYASETLGAERLSEQLGSRLVLCENVRQVLDYVSRGEVEGGFVYRTDARSAQPGEVKVLFEIPVEMHSPILYGVGRMAGSSNQGLADGFLTFVLQPESLEVFSNAGFLTLGK